MLCPTFIPILLLGFFVSQCGFAQSVEQGPFTVKTIADNVFNIEDATLKNPRGFHLDAAGERTGMNNSSDMYLIVGTDRALLIDLSNPVSWHEGAYTSLATLVHERIGDRPLYISATHRHGDHLGMLPAFLDDPRVMFWFSREEFADLDLLPEDATEYFMAGQALDLGGGIVVDTLELPGHTPHSVLFHLKNQHLLFTGDAMGSGSGVWLLDYASFLSYASSIDKLVAYLENPANESDPEALTLWSAHTWQYGALPRLDLQYVLDMQTLISWIGRGDAEPDDYAAGMPFLNATFTYGSATITWNREAAERYRAQQPAR